MDAKRVSIDPAAASVKPGSPALAALSASRYAEGTVDQPKADGYDGVLNRGRQRSAERVPGCGGHVWPRRHASSPQVGWPGQHRKGALHNGLGRCEVVIPNRIRAR